MELVEKSTMELVGRLQEIERAAETLLENLVDAGEHAIAMGCWWGDVDNTYWHMDCYDLAEALDWHLEPTDKRGCPQK